MKALCRAEAKSNRALFGVIGLPCLLISSKGGNQGGNW
jgi:hypothetical protein